MDTTQLIAAQLTLQSLSPARSPGQTLSQSFAGRSNDVSQQISFAEFSQQLLQQGRSERQPERASPTPADHRETHRSESHPTKRNDTPDESQTVQHNSQRVEQQREPEREPRIDETETAPESDQETATPIGTPGNQPSDPAAAQLPTVVNATLSVGAEVSPKSTVSPDALQVVVASAPNQQAANLDLQPVDVNPTPTADGVAGSGAQNTNGVTDQVAPPPATTPQTLTAETAGALPTEATSDAQATPGSTTAAPLESNQQQTQPTITQQTQAMASADAADQQALQNDDNELAGTGNAGSDAATSSERSENGNNLSFGSGQQQGANNAAAGSAGQAGSNSSSAQASFADNITLPMTAASSQATNTSAGGKPVPGAATLHLDSLLSGSPTNQAVDQAMKTLRHSALESIRNEGKEVQLEIAPKHLGALKVQVRQTSEGLETQIIATERMASELLNGNRDQLAQALQELGYDSVEVDIRHQGSQAEDAWQDTSGGDQPSALQTHSIDQPKRSPQDRPDEAGGLNIVA
ncbi:Flagellar hook-length control protein FliK [Stieleria bergensis]|uniref:Flagellar hook-length control protein FliK n=1 Tax=Stieleria bergensis TaxID=2528025 RepID=A0A517SU51_9BACT|nr:Flagellar hook-length control protein FliK [Planctomycetes bacterium SV_7m_r]